MAYKGNVFKTPNSDCIVPIPSGASDWGAMPKAPEGAPEHTKGDLPSEVQIADVKGAGEGETPFGPNSK